MGTSNYSDELKRDAVAASEGHAQGRLWADSSQHLSQATQIEHVAPASNVHALFPAFLGKSET